MKKYFLHNDPLARGRGWYGACPQLATDGRENEGKVARNRYTYSEAPD